MGTRCLSHRQCPIPVYQLQMDKKTEEAPYLDIGISSLYDTHKNPGEQYERLGLESYQMKNHI